MRSLNRLRLVWLLFAAAFLSGHAVAHSQREPARKVVKKKPPRSEQQAFGRAGDARQVTRTLTIRLSDAMRFQPEQVMVKRGSTVRLAARNVGSEPHELVLGTMDELKKLAEAAKKERHEESAPHIVRVAPGATRHIVWQFNKPGEFYYGCLVPGHFGAGMIGTIVVR